MSLLSDAQERGYEALVWAEAVERLLRTVSYELQKDTGHPDPELDQAVSCLVSRATTRVMTCYRSMMLLMFGTEKKLEIDGKIRRKVFDRFLAKGVRVAHLYSGLMDRGKTSSEIDEQFRAELARSLGIEDGDDGK